MRVRFAAPAGIVVLLAVAGCGSETSKSVVGSHDCFAAWNARGNERNRADLGDGDTLLWTNSQGMHTDGPPRSSEPSRTTCASSRMAA